MRKLLEELFAAYYADVCRYLYSLCRDASLAEELASETFLEAVKSIALFRGEADLRTWLFSIARHRWYAWLRKKHREPPVVQAQEDWPSMGKGPEDTILDQAAAQRIRQLLAQEPERTGKIVEMRMEGLSFREIGQKLGISENSARVIEFRAKNRIRSILKKEGWDNG